jgi:hypothetical protein
MVRLKVSEKFAIFDTLSFFECNDRQFERYRLRNEDKIKKHLHEIEEEFVNWIHLVQDRDRWRAVVKTVMNPFRFRNDRRTS